MIFGQYFPNPALLGTDPLAQAMVSPFQAFLVEAFGTALLVLVVFVVSHPRSSVPGPIAAPGIGLTVAVLICVFAPLTQAEWNPARDLGPRLVALLAGYGSIAIPAPQTGFWVYLAGPLLGGLVGGGIAEYAVALRRACTASQSQKGLVGGPIGTNNGAVRSVPTVCKRAIERTCSSRGASRER